MTAISEQPTNLNFLSPLNFRFQIKKCPNINFFAQQVNIAGITNPSAPTPNPFTQIPQTGDHITFEDLVVVFKVDEQLTNYLEIYNWIRELGFPEDWAEYAEIKNKPKNLGTGIVSDMSLMILSSSMKPIYECIYIDAYPYRISGIQFSTVENDVNFITCTANFIYTNFRMNKIVS